MALESKFKRDLVKDLHYLFPGSIVLKNDPNYLQGIPDLLILFEDKWAALETKKSKGSIRQVNQEYYIDLLNRMSYASFINPRNREQVLNELQQTFQSHR